MSKATISREEFLRRRKSGLGGSDIAAIMGMSKFRTAEQVWLDKISDEIHEEQSDVLELACYLEEYAAQKYSNITGYKVRRRNLELIHKDYPFLKGNIDREILGDPRGIGILEIKALSNFSFRAVEMKGLPADYICQKQDYFLCGNGYYKWGAFAILNRDNGRMLTFETKPDEEFQKLILEAAVPFWTVNVEQKIRPKNQNNSMEKKIDVPTYTGTITDLTSNDRLNELVVQRIENMALVEEAHALLKQTDEAICAELGDCEAAECKGARFYYKSSSRTSVDTKKLKQERPEIYKQYSKTTETARSLKFYKLEANQN